MSPRARQKAAAQFILAAEEATLLDLVDNTLSKGVVLTGEITLALAQVDLVYARVSLLLCAADRVLPGEERDLIARRQARQAARADRRLARLKSRSGKGGRPPRG
jgi:hypothetical protein